MTPLCGNSDCSTFLDARAVPYENLSTHVVVMLCHDCSEYVRRNPYDHKFRAVELPLEGEEP